MKKLILLMFMGSSKNSVCHSERSEESSIHAVFRFFTTFRMTVIRTFLISLIFFSSGNESRSQLTKTVVSLTGTVINEMTKEAVSIDLELFDTTGTRINRTKSNSKTGYYFITGLEPGKRYLIRNLVNIESPKKYLKQRFEINIPNTNKYEEFSKDFQIIPMEVGLEYKLIVSPFYNGKTVIRSGADIFMKDILGIMKDNPRLTFEIRCYPDKIDNVTVNGTLTTERCNILKNYFVEKGIKSERFIAITGEKDIDPLNPFPPLKPSKGKKYKGPIYIVIKSI